MILSNLLIGKTGNKVTTQTKTDISGLIKGDGASIGAAKAGKDYAAADHTHSVTDIGAEKEGTASGAVSAHNSDTTAHSDIRQAIENIEAPVQSVNGQTGAVTVSVPSKTSDLTNDSGYITDYVETDPTVPVWAKATNKPSYTKSEVGLSNVDNVKQYSVSNPPPYPVTSVNGKTGAITIAVPEIKVVSATLYASDWGMEGMDSPMTQHVQISDLTSSDEGEIGLAADITAEQLTAAAGAMLHLTYQDTGYVVVTAFGETPNVDIPIVIRVVRTK